MDRDESAADRIRPILKAMERSIEHARRERTHDEPEPASEIDQPERDEQRDVEPAPEAQEFDPTKMKARPKRRFLTQH